MDDHDLFLLAMARDTPCQFYYEITGMIEKAHSLECVEKLKSCMLLKRMQEQRAVYGHC